MDYDHWPTTHKNPRNQDWFDLMLEKSAKSAEGQNPVIVKKYANRRLYNTETSTYVTLEDLAIMVRADRDFVVKDAKSGDDLTHSVLTQIIVEQESRQGGSPLLPVPFLRQLIRFYGKGIEKMVPSYLQLSLEALAREQDHYTKQFASAFTSSPFEAYQEQAHKNLEAYKKTMAVFSPFSNPAGSDAAGVNPAEMGEPPGGTPSPRTAGASSEQGNPAAGDLAAMKKQLDQMQKTIEQLSKSSSQDASTKTDSSQRAAGTTGSGKAESGKAGKTAPGKG